MAMKRKNEKKNDEKKEGVVNFCVVFSGSKCENEKQNERMTGRVRNREPTVQMTK